MMGARRKFSGAATMATRWRVRRMCVLVADAPAPAALRDVSARHAYLETNARPQLGSEVELRHPEAGAITGTVRSVSTGGVEIAFPCTEQSVAFALAAITADMSQPTLDG